MKRTIERITRAAMLAVAFMLCATGQAWAVSITNSGKGNYDKATFGASDTWTITIPATGGLLTGDRVHVDTINIGLNAASADNTLYKITIDTEYGTISSGIINGTGDVNTTGSYYTAGGWKNTFTFNDNCILEVGKSYPLGILDSNDSSAKAYFGLRKNTEALYAPICQSSTYVGNYRICQEVIVTKIDSVADGDSITSAGNITLDGGTVTVPAGARTAGAVFVQADTTLKFEAGATLTIGGGTGPLYIADGVKLTIDASAIADLEEGTPTEIVTGSVFGKNQINVVTSFSAVGGKVTDSSIVLGKGAYWKWAYADPDRIWSWASTEASFHSSGKTKYTVFDVATGSDTETSYTYTGAANEAAHWQRLVYSTISELYDAPGPVVRFVSGATTGDIKMDASPLTLGGIIVEKGATGFNFAQSIPSNTGAARDMIWGDPTGVVETWFSFQENFTVKRDTNTEGAGRGKPLYGLFGGVNILVDSDKVLTFNSDAEVAQSAEKAAGCIGTTTPGGALKMHGAGKLTVPTLTASGSTLDYSDLAADRSAAFIDGTLVVDSSTQFRFPASASFPYPVATTIADNSLYTDSIPYVVGTTPGTSKLFLGPTSGKAAPATAFTVDSDARWSTLTSSATTGAYVIDVTESAELEIDTASISLVGLQINVANGKTLTLTGSNTLAAETIILTGEGCVKTTVASVLSGVIKGNGTLIYNGATPSGMTFSNAGWIGTLWLENVTISNFDPTDYGNSGSTVTVSEVSATLEAEGNTFEGTFVLSDKLSNGSDSEYALQVTNGNASKTLGFSGDVGGSGTLKFTSNAPAHTVYLSANKNSFNGSIVNEGSAKVRIGSGTADPGAGGIVVTMSGVHTIATGKAWNTTGTINVRNLLTNNGSIVCKEFTLNSKDDVSVDGSGDLTAESVVVNNGTFANAGTLTVSGTVDVYSGATLTNTGTANIGTLTANGTVTATAQITANTMTVGASSTVTGDYYGGGSGTLTLNKSSTATYTGYKTLNIAASVAQDDTGLSLDALNLGDGATYTTDAGKEGAVCFSGESTGTLNLTATSNQIDYDGHTPAVYGTGTVNYTGTGTGTITTSGYALLPYYSVWTPQAGAGSTGNGAWWRNSTAPAASKNVAFGVAGDSEVAITVNTTLAYGEAQVYGAGSGNFTKTESNAISFTKLSVISGATLTLDADSGVIVSSEIYVEQGATLILDGYAPVCNITGGGTIQIKGNITLTTPISVQPNMTVASGTTATLAGTVPANKITPIGDAKITVESTGTLTLNGYTLDVPVDGDGSVVVTGGNNVIASGVVPTVTVSGTPTLNATDATFATTINVPADATLNLQGTLILNGAGANFMTFSGFTGTGTIECAAGNTIIGTMKTVGEGAGVTIAYPSKVLPVIVETGVAGTTWTDSAWRGTILLRDCGAEVADTTQDDVLFELYGNENSKIRAPGFKGHWAKEASICEAELYLAEGDVVEFNHGTSEIVGTTDVGFRFAKLSGTGTLRLDGTSDKAQYIFEDVSGFAGSVEITNPNPYAAVGGKKSFVFGVSRETDVQGSEYAANLVIAGNVTVPANKTWDTPAGVIIWSGATLTLGNGSTISGISPKSSGTLTVANGTDSENKNSATINSIIGTSIAETVTITIPGFATLKVSDTEDISGKVKGTDDGAEAKITTLTLPADSTVSIGNYFNSGALDLSGCTALTTLTLKLGQSKEFDLAKVSLPGTCTTLIYDVGSQRNLTGYSVPTLSGNLTTFYYLVDENASEYGSGSITIENVPEISGAPADVKVNGMGSGGLLNTAESGSSRTASHTPGISGSGCWHDWEFDNSLDDANTAHADTKIAMSGVESNMYQQDGATANYFVKLDAAKPYPSSAPGLTAPWSAAIRCTMPGQNKVAIAFGSNANGAVALVSGEITAYNNDVPVAGVVRLVNWTGSELKTLAKLVVERPTIAQHVYAFSFREETVEAVTHRYVAFYRDGEFIHEAEYSVSSAITNFKLGAVDGGVEGTGLSEATSGLVDYVRLYNTALSTAMAEALAAESPFVSSIETYTRSLVSGAYNWWTENSWTKVSDGTTAGSPEGNTHATLISSAESTVSVNIANDTTYATMILAGEGSITFTRGIGTGKIGAQTLVVRTPTTVTYGAASFANAMVNVDPGASLTFDFSDYPFGTITSVSSPETVYLTGEVVAREYDNTVDDRIRVTGTPEHTWTVSNPAYDSENKHFYVTITPDHTAGAEIYYKSGYITAGMDGDGGTNIGTVFNNADLADNHKTTLFAGDTVVVSSGSPPNAWISDKFNGNLKVTRTVFNLKPGSPNSILNGRTITVASGSTLNLAKETDRPFRFGALTLAGDGTVNFIDEATVATLTSSVGTLTVANGKTLTVTTLALPAETPVTVGSLLLKVSGAGTVNLSGVTVGGTPTPLRWTRKTVDGIDGIYVISGTIFSVW